MDADTIINAADDAWTLPGRWAWTVCRVVHCLPDDQTDGWRLTLSCGGRVSIEVLHRSPDHARKIALDAAASLFPTEFQSWHRAGKK